MLFLIVLGLGCLAGAAYFVGDAVTAPARERQSSVRRAATYGRFRPALARGQLPFRERVLVPLGERLARWTLKLHPKTTTEGVGTRLLAAGLGRKISPTTFLALKSACAIGGFALGALFGGALTGAGGVLLFAIALAGIGFIGPDFAVSAKARSRRETIRAELPDALDLMAVSVEAGMGFDGAIAKLTEHMDGPLADEFGLTLNEIRIGETRQDALKKLADRTDTPELSSFVRAIIQADQLGISLGRILRVQAADSRLKRQAAAEEKAMKAPIKMLFPTVMFIFPAMFLVILGPAFLNISKIF
ncbi:MAG TPA: type II secretion system F family protein [Gaiellaceae bacterium]|jgi:tight adherence protein C|nr:type II secretion system F family protein [Gaiellaceae bacterium]